MVVLFFILLSAIIWLRKVGFGLSPASVFFWYFFISLLVFYVNESGLVYFEPYRGMPIEMGGEYSHSSRVYVVGLLLLYSLVFVAVRQNSTIDQLAQSMRAATDRVQVVMMVLGITISLLFLWHFVEVDLSPLFRTHLYLSNVDAADVGLKSIPGVVAHHLMGPGGLMVGFLSVYFFSRNKWLLVMLFFVSFSYALFVKVSQMSRWAPLMVLGIALLVYFVLSNRSKALPLLVVAFSFFLMSVVLVSRGGGVQGFDGVVAVVMEGRFWNSDVFHELIPNIFGGFIVYAESLDVPWEYDFSYIWRSFSVLPSGLDGWRNYYADGGRINAYSPFNFLSEVYFFGLVFEFSFFFFWIWTVGRMDRQFSAKGGVARYLPLMLLLYVVVSCLYYPVRNVFRVYLLAWLMFEFLGSKKRGSTGKGDEGLGDGTV